MEEKTYQKKNSENKIISDAKILSNTQGMANLVTANIKLAVNSDAKACVTYI